MNIADCIVNDVVDNIDRALKFEGLSIFDTQKNIYFNSQIKQIRMSIPNLLDDSESCHLWASQIENIWLGFLGLEIEKTIFTQLEAEAFYKYLYIIKLLLSCKVAAVRIPKQAWAELEARLLTV